MFYGAFNPLTEKLEIWGFPTISDCQSAQEFTAKYYQTDYLQPSACVVIKLTATTEPKPAAVDYEAISQRPSLRTLALQTAFKHACYTGCSMAQVGLPKVPQENELLARGFLSCDGYLINEPGLIEDDHLLSTACGYAVGAMYSKYGLHDEVVGADGKPHFSARVLAATRLCLAELAKQKMPGANSELDGFDKTIGVAGRSK